MERENIILYPNYYTFSHNFTIACEKLQSHLNDVHDSFPNLGRKSTWIMMWKMR